MISPRPARCAGGGSTGVCVAVVGTLLIAGLLGVYEAGAGAGAGAVDDRAVLLATPWAGARWANVEIALQAPLRYVPSEGRLRAADWDEPADYGRILRFFRYGRPEDGFALNLGAIARRTLGHGTLVRRYHNGVDDDHHRVGLAVEAHGGDWRLEAVADHVLGPPVLIVRASTAVGAALELGATFAADAAAPRAVDGGLDDDGHALAARTGFEPAYGADATLRFEPAGWLAIEPYADVNRIHEGGVGLHAGAVTRFALGAQWALSLRLEGIWAGAGYDWAFFDTAYLVDRWTPKLARVEALPAARGARVGLDLEREGTLAVGIDAADATGPDRADLSAWIEIPLEGALFRAFYARRPTETVPEALLDPGESLAAAALRVRLADPWWLGASVARVWRLRTLAPDRAALRPVTEGALTAEAAFGF